MNFKQILTKEFLEKEYVNNNKSTRQIANQVGCDKSTVTVYLRKHNITILNKRERAATSNNLIEHKRWQLLKMDWDNNNEESPTAYSAYSNKKVNWVCHICGYKWRTSINSRTNGCNCQKCYKKNKPNIQLSTGSKRNNLTKHKRWRLLKTEWDYNKNKNKPNSYGAGSHFKLWWICSKCGYSWKTSIRYRTLKNSNCPKCCLSYGNIYIHKILKKLNTHHIMEYRFIDCKDKRPLPFDCYIPSLNIAIEYQGKHHYELRPNWGGNKHLKYVQKHDKIKASYCKKNKINLIIIPYWEFENIEDILKEILSKC